MKKRLLGMVLAVAMASSLALTGCGSGGDSGQSNGTQGTGGSSEQENTSSSGGQSGDLSNLGYTFATNDFGQGEYSLDINAWIIDSVAQHVGSTVDVVDNQFTVDNIVTQLRSQLSKGPDGVCMIGIAETVFPAISQACQEANVPYAFFATPPVDADVETMEEDPLYAGTVLFDPEAEAAYLAEKAYEAGGRKAVILAGAQGDYNHDHRITGFTKKFEELGGKVLDVARCDNPGQGDEKGSNLLSANKDADVAIGAGAGYITSLEGVREKMGLDYKIYGCDTTPNLIQDVIDGKVEIISAGANTGAGFAEILLINKLLGHPILDADGKAPYTKDLTLFYCDSSNCEKFQKFWDECQKSPLTQEEVMNLIGEDVTYDDFITALKNYADDSYAKIDKY
ncbi:MULTISPECIES: sugar ABC transporter substrate-binding protein [Clostridia]|uniref:sugar ABC transporter substrate-binding protein n=1 Tax=Clostridia TaxID=186801 RepID=UPI000E5493DD|nr:MULTISPECIES: substrate-binding domain-containing protein [Clostridia]RHV72192.1 sugar ABC transporter substrate-binding protein [Roseburia sp. OM02-15]